MLELIDWLYVDEIHLKNFSINRNIVKSLKKGQSIAANMIHPKFLVDKKMILEVYFESDLFIYFYRPP